jgi:signal transduction histidine kinase
MSNTKKWWRPTSLPIRLSILFLISILFLEIILFSLLYRNILNDRVTEEIERLMARGNSYSNVLEDHFDRSTLVHISQIESETDTKVAILNNNHQIVITSTSFDSQMRNAIFSSSLPSREQSSILVSDWRNQPNLITISPVNGTLSPTGFVYMFLPTKKIVDIEFNLQKRFFFMTIFALTLTMCMAIFLSRFVASPINRLNIATKKLLNGNAVSLTEEKRRDEIGDLARTIQQMSTDLEKLKMERTNFFTDLAHELRTPVTYICGYSEILKNEKLKDETRAQAVRVIHNEGLHLTKLISDVFELARMDTTSFKLQRKNVSLEAVYDEAVRIGETIAESYNYMFESKLTGDKSINLLVDADRLLQVFRIIFTNACVHSEGEALSFRMDVLNHGVTFEISDDGKGIPLDEQQKIFERLYRVEKSRSRETGGSGLGLAIAKQIILHHEGMIEVSDNTPKGTTFTVCLKIMKN